MNKLKQLKKFAGASETWHKGEGAIFTLEETKDIIELIEAAQKLLDAKTALSTNTAKPRLRLAVKPFTEEKE